MDDLTTKQTALDVIYLAGCAVNSTVPDQNRVKEMNLEGVYAVASEHMISAAVAMALASAGIQDQHSRSAINVAIRRTAIMDQAWDEIRGRLEQNGIWYMPLKGTVLKDYYPRYGMREMADHDILFDATRADDVKNIMEGLGYETERFGISNHDCYFREPVLNFEMHRALFWTSADEKLCEYYRNVEDRLTGDGFQKSFPPDDFYLYMIAHEYKHYSAGGTGLRSLLDTYVYLKHQTVDTAYIAAETEKMGIRDFEEKNRSLSLHLFNGDELIESDQEMLDYILSSGTYGTFSRRVENKIRKKSRGKFLYMLERFFVPVSRKNREYAAYARVYPFFYKHRILLPILPFYRVFRAMKNGRFQAEAKAIRDAKQ